MVDQGCMLYKLTLTRKNQSYSQVRVDRRLRPIFDISPEETDGVGLYNDSGSFPR